MKNRKLRFLVSLAAWALIIYVALWLAINYFFIPRILIPKVRGYIAENAHWPLNLEIKNIYFDPLKGFMLKQVRVCGRSEDKDCFLSAKLVDVDLDLLPLFWKQVSIKKVVMLGAELNILRDKSGLWNFQPLLELGSAEKKDSGCTSLIIKNFLVKDGAVHYRDSLKEENALERRFSDVEISLRNRQASIYDLHLYASGKEKPGESLALNLICDLKDRSLAGQVKIMTRYLGEYWNYYLDEILRPWHLKAEDVDLQMKFAYSEGVLLLEGQDTLHSATLNYGDFSIRADASVRQRLRYVNGAWDKEATRIGLDFKNVSLLIGRHAFLENGECLADINDRQIDIEKLDGLLSGQAVYYKGIFTFSEPQELNLVGRFADIYNNFNLKILPDNRGAVYWWMEAENSRLQINMQLSDLKSLALNLDLQGNLDLKDLSGILKVRKENIRGNMDISGNIAGELDKPVSLQGALEVDVDNLSLFGLDPESFEVRLSGKDGLFTGGIPRLEFCKGSLYGKAQFDYDRWGVELNIDGLDVSEIARKQESLKGMSGKFYGNVACVSKWGETSGIKGGGYLILENCSLGKGPLFLRLEEGIKSAAKDFTIPDFKEIRGNFEIKDAGINFVNLMFKSPKLSLLMHGRYDFSGALDMTAGVAILGGGFFKTARQILLPYSIGFDVLTNSIQIRISGRWPDLKHQTTIRPIGWLDEFFGLINQTVTVKRTIDSLW